MRRTGTRIYGPYEDKQRGSWTVVVVPDRGERTAKRCATKDEAHRLVAELEEELKLEGPITVATALEEYERYIVAKGNKPVTVYTTMHRLRSLLDPQHLLHGSLVRVDAGDAYARLAASGCSVDYHQNTLGQARTFGKWCVKRGYLRRNPWVEVEPVGKRRKGKAKLRVDEARALMATCVRLDDSASVAAMCGLLLGFGASEIVERVGRDVDDGGAILWMDSGKTENRERHVEVPLLPPPLDAEWLRRKLAELAAAAGPTGYLWRAESRRSKKGHRDRNWVLDNVKRLCKAAGVPEITAHGLRGTQGTIGASEGIVPQVVANALGNTEAVARAHYIRPGAAETGRSKRALQVLAGGKR